MPRIDELIERLQLLNIQQAHLSDRLAEATDLVATIVEDHSAVVNHVSIALQELEEIRENSRVTGTTTNTARIPNDRFKDSTGTHLYIGDKVRILTGGVGARKGTEGFIIKFTEERVSVSTRRKIITRSPQNLLRLPQE